MSQSGPASEYNENGVTDSQEEDRHEWCEQLPGTMYATTVTSRHTYTKQTDRHQADRASAVCSRETFLSLREN